jgi:thiosulfate/3-mercaptopyruvate sulfurtransferase
MDFTTLISVPELHSLQASHQPHMIFDCSFDLAKPEAGYAAYLESHIAGAIYVNLDTDLSAKADASAASGGRHPLPSREKFAAWLSSIGFTNEMQAIIYDRNHTMIAGRLWWMLKWLGHERVAVLDGGFPLFEQDAASKPLLAKGLEAQRLASANPQGLQLSSPLVSLVDASFVAPLIGSPQAAIVDARATPRFKGEVEPLDPVAGHIPSALNRPFTQNFDESGRFKSPEQLREEFDHLLAGRDAAQTVHHCGSGVSALPNVLAMTVAGFGLTTLYAGSWSDWCSDAARPVAQG